MVLIILDVLSCDVPTNANVCAPRVSDLSEVYKSTNAFGHLQFFFLHHCTGLDMGPFQVHSSHLASHV